MAAAAVATHLRSTPPLSDPVLLRLAPEDVAAATPCAACEVLAATSGSPLCHSPEEWSSSWLGVGTSVYAEVVPRAGTPPPPPTLTTGPQHSRESTLPRDLLSCWAIIGVPVSHQRLR